MVFNEQQKKLINSHKPKILCISHAAAGKTSVLTERIRHLIKEENVAPKDIVAITFTKLAAREMRQRLDDLDTSEMFIGTVHSYALKICGLNEISMYTAISQEEYDRILVTAAQLPKAKYVPIKHLLIDEAQDLTTLEYAFIDKIPTENIFYVGDPRQCQPAGTKIKLNNGNEINIEDVKVGDSLVWYDNTYGIVSKPLLTEEQHKVLKVASRDFSNDYLITVHTKSGKASSYTPNHICFARLTRARFYGIFLVEDYSENYSLKVDILPCPHSEEGFKKVWLLKEFHTEAEATTYLNAMNNIHNFKYGKVDAIICLKEFCRDIDYPLYENNNFDSLGYTVGQPREIYAANLMPTIMELVTYSDNEFENKEYEPISFIDYKWINEPVKVYSLEVEGGTYIADNIITHNCIYQFKGGSDRFIIEKYNDPSYANYSLSVNYRNAPNILEFANSFIRHNTPYGKKTIPIKKEKGLLETGLEFGEALEYMEESKDWGNWAILARTNNEISQVQQILDEEEIPNITFKKSDFDDPELMDRAMRENSVKVLTAHTSKGLEFLNVIVIGIRSYNEAEANLAYVAATRAMNKLFWCKKIKGLKKGIRNNLSKSFSHSSKDDGMIDF